jgi:hypothetical protein
MEVPAARVNDLKGTSAPYESQPQVSGANRGRAVSLQSLSCERVTLRGRGTGIQESRTAFGDNLLV